MSSSSAAIPEDGRRTHISLMLLNEPGGLEYRRWRQMLDEVDRATRPDRDGGDEDSRLEDAEPTLHIVWRMNSANWRRLAWSASDFDTTAHAHAHARTNIERVAELEVEPLQLGNEYGWRMHLAGEPAFVSARWWPTARGRDYSVARTLEAFSNGVNTLLLPPPFDHESGRWAHGVSMRDWIEVVEREVRSQIVEDTQPRERVLTRRTTPERVRPGSDSGLGI